MITAIIPARGGSKGVPRKNIRKLYGFPLIAYSIAACRLSTKIDRIVVSTDSIEIAQIAEHFGAEVPFLRPDNISTDSSTDIEFMYHALHFFNKEGKTPEYIVHIRPTTPLREPQKIDEAIETLINFPEATSLRSVHEIRESPYKLFEIEDGYLAGMYPDDPRPEYYNLPRQTFPKVYQPNGYVDIIRVKSFLESGSLHGKNMLPFLTENVGEIDTEYDFGHIRYMLEKNTYRIYQYLTEKYEIQ